MSLTIWVVLVKQQQGTRAEELKGTVQKYRGTAGFQEFLLSSVAVSSLDHAASWSKRDE